MTTVSTNSFDSKATSGRPVDSGPGPLLQVLQKPANFLLRKTLRHVIGMPQLRRFPAVARPILFAMRWHHARSDAYPDWQPLLDKDGHRWSSARLQAQTGPRILMASSVGAHTTVVTLESIIAAALTLRGANVDVLLCDEALPVCIDCSVSAYGDVARFVKEGPARDLCRDCRWPAERVYKALGLTVHRYGEWLTPSDREEARATANALSADAIPAYTRDGMAIGEQALAGALRFFAVGSLDAESHGEAVLRRYLESALLTALATRRVVQSGGYATLVATHGIYVPWGLVGEAARASGTHVVNWCAAYRKGHYLFSHDRTYHHELVTEPNDRWDAQPLSQAEDDELAAYLAARRGGRGDWRAVHHARCHDPHEAARRLGLDPEKPIIGLLTNVIWDAQVHYPNRAFPSMLEWLVQTCDYFSRRQDLQLLIRLHPSEVTGAPATRQPVLPVLRQRLPKLPPNIFVVPPDCDMSTYALMDLCNAAIIYATVTGIELTSVGLPVIVAGEAWIRNKRIAHDASTVDDYFAILDELPFPGRLTTEQLARAKRYAYHFFFRRLIPLAATRIGPTQQSPRLNLGTLDELLPGTCRGLDTICNGILEHRPFVLPRTVNAFC